MMSVLMPISGFARKSDDEIRGDADFRLDAPQLLDDAQVAGAGVAAVHQFQHAVAAALDGQMRVLDEFGQPRVSLNQIVAVSFRMRRGKPDAFQPIDFVNGVKELDEG